MVRLVANFFSFGRIGGANKLPTKYDFGCGSLTLFDAITGRELGNIDNVHLDSCEIEKGTQFGNWMRQNVSMTIECSIDEIDETASIRKILGLDIPHPTDTCDIQYEKLIQARTHKKKRINKKWLKRYGYKRITIISQGWNWKTDVDGNTEFIKV